MGRSRIACMQRPLLTSVHPKARGLYSLTITATDGRQIAIDERVPSEQLNKVVEALSALGGMTPGEER
jgi:hypothetical protein